MTIPFITVLALELSDAGTPLPVYGQVGGSRKSLLANRAAVRTRALYIQRQLRIFIRFRVLYSDSCGYLFVFGLCTATVEDIYSFSGSVQRQLRIFIRFRALYSDCYGYLFVFGFCLATVAFVYSFPGSVQRLLRIRFRFGLCTSKVAYTYSFSSSVQQKLGTPICFRALYSGSYEYLFVSGFCKAAIRGTYWFPRLCTAEVRDTYFRFLALYSGS